MNQAFILSFYEDWEFWTSAIGTLVTVFLGLVVWYSTKKYNKTQIDLTNDRLQKELFTEFNSRYDELNNYLEIIVKSKTLKSFKKEKDYDQLSCRLSDYFNLCAEEYYWYKKGRIDELIWNSWQTGMNSWYNNHPIIREAWEKELKNFGCQSFYLKEGERFFKNY